MNVSDIVKTYLKKHGADGLYQERENCGCGIDDLCPGCHDEIPLSCVPARRRVATKEDIDVYPDVNFEVGDLIYVEMEDEEYAQCSRCEGRGFISVPAGKEEEKE